MRRPGVWEGSEEAEGRKLIPCFLAASERWKPRKNWYVVCCPSASGKSLSGQQFADAGLSGNVRKKKKKGQQSEMFCHGRRIIKNREARGFKRDLLRRGRMIKMYCFLSDMWE